MGEIVLKRQRASRLPEVVPRFEPGDRLPCSGIRIGVMRVLPPNHWAPIKVPNSRWRPSFYRDTGAQGGILATRDKSAISSLFEHLQRRGEELAEGSESESNLLQRLPWFDSW